MVMNHIETESATLGNMSRIALSSDWSTYNERLQKRSNLIFSNPEQLEIQLISKSYIFNAHPTTTSLTIKNEAQLEDCLQKTSADAFRVISFAQAYSLDPLQCTQEAMMKVVRYWKISSIFLDVLLKFGDQEQVFEESSGFRQAFQSPDGSYELSYQLMYVEPSGRPNGRDPWSFRQTGVYQRYDGQATGTVSVLLHPKLNSVAQKKIESSTQNEFDPHALARSPLSIHLFILKSYIPYWTDFLESSAASLSEMRTHILVVDARESKIEPEKLQSLRNLEDKITCKALRCLRSTLKLAETLLLLNEPLLNGDPTGPKDALQVQKELQLLIHRIEGYVNTAELLAERIQATLGLLANLLGLQSQTASDQISGHILRLTRKNVDDNATVRVITICTLIYLPATFVATLFGMNFFNFEANSGTIHISPWFWVYVAATLPLTVVTVGGWYLVKSRQEKKKRNHEEEEV